MTYMCQNRHESEITPTWMKQSGFGVNPPAWIHCPVCGERSDPVAR